MRRKLNAPTSYEVARHAGVSQAVVSRAFQAVSPISADARARVLASAAALGYQPNAVARSLITKRSGLAGVLLTEATQRDTPDVLIHLAQSLLHQGFQPLLFPCRNESEGSSALVKALSFGVDGVVACVSLSPEDLKRARLYQRPVVLFNRQSMDPKALRVACDHASATQLLASRLFAAGHRRYAVVSGPADAPVSALRTSSFLARLEELGVKAVVTYEGDYHYESGHAAAMKLLAQSRHQKTSARPEVVFCANDSMALGVLDAARFALMLRVPGDVSVVGFDDIPAGRRPAYLLSTVSQPINQMAEAAALLFRQAVDEQPVTAFEVLLQGTLIERGSAKLLPDALSTYPATRP
jgi:DNA-binding LacI/PurR family transcriptional regulator